MTAEKSKDLLIISFGSLGDVLQAINVCPFISSENLCEQIHYGGSSDLLFVGVKHELALWASSIASKIDYEIIENVHPGLLRGFFHLENKPLLASVLVVETVSLIQLFLALDGALKSALDLSEIRIPRFHNSFKAIVLSGSQQSVSEVYNKHKNNGKITVTKIENVNQSLRQLY